jgi:hypothetical protein
MNDTAFRFSRWFIIDVNSVFELLHLVDVGDGADVSEMHAASIFRVYVGEFVYIQHSIVLTYRNGTSYKS